jgi:hypothetical protein
MPFARYSTKSIKFQSILQNVRAYNYTPIATRGLCDKCADHIFMIYNSSPNIWINVNLFKFPHNHIKTYDIY